MKHAFFISYNVEYVCSAFFKKRPNQSESYIFDTLFKSVPICFFWWWLEFSYFFYHGNEFEKWIFKSPCKFDSNSRNINKAIRRSLIFQLCFKTIGPILQNSEAKQILKFRKGNSSWRNELLAARLKFRWWELLVTWLLHSSRINLC